MTFWGYSDNSNKEHIVLVRIVVHNNYRTEKT